jgi:hypothetical protein
MSAPCEFASYVSGTKELRQDAARRSSHPRPTVCLFLPFALAYFVLIGSTLGQRTNDGSSTNQASARSSKIEEPGVASLSALAEVTLRTDCCLSETPDSPTVAGDDAESARKPLSSSRSTTSEEFIQQVISNTPRTEIAQESVNWRSLMNNSLLYLGTMHIFRIGTEQGTRDALNNSVVGGYFATLGAMHGWSDGDGYYENYLGHPIDGAVAGYIWLNNDPRYRYVEFGRSRAYWMSRLRAYAFAWVFSEQFEVGPVSEASIGQIQRYCCAYGFVDHVITPNGGLVWMVAGDAADKYIVRKIEDRTRNRLIRVLARSILNPPLSFANMMAFKVPWNRLNRPGIHDYDGTLYVRPETANPIAGSSSIPRFELSATIPFFMRIGSAACVGGGGTGGFRISPSWQWTGEVGGCSIAGSLPKDWSGDSLTFSTGPQWIRHSNSRWTPRFHFRVGGQKITEQYSDPVLKQKVLKTTPPLSPNKAYYDYVTPYETTGLSLSVGGGVDFRLYPGLAVRIGSIDYVHSWLGNLNGANFNHGVRLSTGLVLRIGTW